MAIALHLDCVIDRVKILLTMHTVLTHLNVYLHFNMLDYPAHSLRVLDLPLSKNVKPKWQRTRASKRHIYCVRGIQQKLISFYLLILKLSFPSTCIKFI